MAQSGDTVEVTLHCGRVVGARHGNVVQFAGVPYAEPPTGARRFQPPAPVRPWSGAVDCTGVAPIAPQLPSRLVGVMGDFSRCQDEDCLRLTITKPAADTGRRPVIVWLHGGGFSSGAGGLDWYDGRRLAAEGDVVIVGVNYRLGALGFLVADGIADGNLGLMDQALALRFVRDTIGAFGGDGNNVTLMGQSAGGNSIVALFAAGQVPPGVRRVVLQSPALGMAPQPLDEARSIGRRFVESLGLPAGSAAARDAVLAMPVAEILAAQARVARGGARYGDTAPPFQLVQGKGLPERTDFHRAAAGVMAGVDTLLGSTLHEADAFLAAQPQTTALTHDEALEITRTIYGEAACQCLERLRARFPEAGAGALFSRLVSEEIFVRPAGEFAAELLDRGAEVFLYDFTWRPERSRFRSCHCLELPFVFGPSASWEGAPMLAGGKPETISRISDAVRAAWISFARTGRPVSSNLPSWPAARRDDLMAMRLDEQARLQIYGTLGAGDL